jgi:RNA methyltransferase, TrmH family
MDSRYISSPQNPLVKEVVKLTQKAGERRMKGSFVAEGVREVSLALKAGIRLKYLFLCEDIYSEDKNYPVNFPPQPQLMRVSREVYSKMAYRGNAEGIMAMLEVFDTSLEQLQVSASPLFLVLESVEKPGNLGAILRTADAAGVDAVIICDPQTDVFNPNVIRSSLGCLFSVKVAICDTQDYFRWAAENKIKTMLASVQASQPYYEADMKQPLALIFGTEADGLSAIWYKSENIAITIPMEGQIDSLNVSASAAILVFEARRQRNLMQ